MLLASGIVLCRGKSEKVMMDRYAPRAKKNARFSFSSAYVTASACRDFFKRRMPKSKVHLVRIFLLAGSYMSEGKTLCGRKRLAAIDKLSDTDVINYDKHESVCKVCARIAKRELEEER
jgi:hypothetical protein